MDLIWVIEPWGIPLGTNLACDKQLEYYKRHIALNYLSTVRLNQWYC